MMTVPDHDDDAGSVGPVIQARVTYCPDTHPRWCVEVGPCHGVPDQDLVGFGDDPLSAALQTVEAIYTALLSTRRERWQRIVRDDADTGGCHTDNDGQAADRAKIVAVFRSIPPEPPR